MNEKTDILLDPEFMKKLRTIRILTRKTFSGKMKGERRSKKKGLSIEFADYRRYVKGDDIRFVDWNIYSRLETLFLKLFMEEEDLYVYLLIDGSKSMGFGTPSKLMFAKRTAAALGYIALCNLDKVGVGVFGSDLLEVQKPLRGQHNAMTLFQFISNINPVEKTNLQKSFKRFVLNTKTRGIAILISDFFDPEGFEDAIKQFVQRNFEIFVIHILSEEELEPDLIGHLELIDAEFDIKTHVSISRDLLNRYKDNLDRFCANLRQFCIKRDITYLRMKNTSRVEDLIFNYLKYRGLLK